MQHHHMITRLWWWLVFMGFGSTTFPHQRAVSYKHGAPVNFVWSDKEPDNSAARADLFTHKYQQADLRCDLRGSRAAIIIYRCGPAALVMEGGEGALTPNRLICCQTTNTTFDVVWFLLTGVVSLPVVADYSGSNHRFCLGKFGACVTKHYKINLERENDIHGSLRVYIWRRSRAPCQIFERLAVQLFKMWLNSWHRSKKCRQARTKSLQSGFRGSFAAETPPQTSQYLTGMKPRHTAADGGLSVLPRKSLPKGFPCSVSFELKLSSYW